MLTRGACLSRLHLALLTISLPHPRGLRRQTGGIARALNCESHAVRSLVGVTTLLDYC
jgi:hypothetical protein